LRPVVADQGTGDGGAAPRPVAPRAPQRRTPLLFNNPSETVPAFGAPPQSQSAAPLPHGDEAPRQPARVGGDDAAVKTVRRDEPKVGRNDPCPCGSGKKYKKCHGAAA
jgi:hypothetical protein